MYRNFDFAVLNVLGMNEFDITQNAELFQEHGANQPIHVTSSQQSIFLVGNHVVLTVAQGSQFPGRISGNSSSQTMPHVEVRTDEDTPYRRLIGITATIAKSRRETVASKFVSMKIAPMQSLGNPKKPQA